MTPTFNESEVAEFSIWRRGRELFRAGLDNACMDLPAPLPETDAFTFEVDRPEPGANYRLLIGDFPCLPTHQGRRGIDWSEDTYFDSARGLTPVTVQSSYDGGPWLVRLRFSANVLPSKATEDGYLAMLESLNSIASGLVLDIAAKSRAELGIIRSVSPAMAAGSPQVALRLLELAWRTWADCLEQILRAPEERLVSFRGFQRWSGGQQLSPEGLDSLLARGVDPRRWRSDEEVLVPTTRLGDSSDTREHAFIGTILALAEARARDYALRARAQISSIEKDRGYREHLVEGVSLYQSIDLPRLGVLYDAAERADAICRQISRVRGNFRSKPLKNLAALGRPSPVFDNVSSYRRFRQTSLTWIATSWTLVEFGPRERMKPTWRMYEQWVFLSLAAAFKVAGLSCTSQRDFAHALTGGRYSVDLDRGARLEFSDARGRRLRLSYEPWILPLELAKARGDQIYQSTTSTAAWSPDILIEAFSGPGSNEAPIFGIVVDAKYSRSPHAYAEKLHKYLRIRSLLDRRQLVRQVWVASPSGDGIRIEDDVVTWGYAGPSAPLDEQLLGYMAASPCDGVPPALIEWAEGILAYLDYDVGAQERQASA